MKMCWLSCELLYLLASAILSGSLSLSVMTDTFLLACSAMARYLLYETPPQEIIATSSSSMALPVSCLYSLGSKMNSVAPSTRMTFLDKSSCKKVLLSAFVKNAATSPGTSFKDRARSSVTQRTLFKLSAQAIMLLWVVMIT